MKQTPDDFVFSIKGSRYITHMLKLRNAEQSLANFFASGLLELGTKMGPMLWQFPPQMGFQRERFAEFFDLLPRTHGAAARLAQLHDSQLDGRSTEVVVEGLPKRTAIRHAIEIRDESFATPEFVELPREQDIGFGGCRYCCVAIVIGCHGGLRLLPIAWF